MFSKILKSEFLRNVLTLMTGTAIAQAIPVLISPVLTRLYTPEDFGVLALFMSVVVIIGTISTARYELAIMLPKHKQDAVNILALSLIINTIISLLSLIIILIFKNQIILLLGSEELRIWLYFAPVTIFFMGVYQAFNYWSTRNKTFTKNAISRVAQSSTIAATNLSVGFVKAGPVGLISGAILGQIIGALVLSWKTLVNFKKFRKQLSVKSIKMNAKKYSNFLKINTPHAFVDSLQDYGIVYIIIYFFSKVILGSYYFAFRILKAPVGLIGGAMSQVFYQKASKAYHDKQNIQPLILRMYKNLFLIGFPLFLILFLFTPDIFSFVFSEKWRVAGEIAQIICPWIFLNFIVSPVSCIAIIMNKQKEAMFITFADILLRIGALIIGGYYNDYKLSFILMSITCTMLLIFALFWYYRIARIKTSDAY